MSIRSGECTITIPETGETSRVSYFFAEEEFAALSCFVTNLDRLSELPIIQAGLPSSLKIAWNHEGMQVSSSLPSQTDLFAALHALRPFILTNEPYSFDYICGVLARRIK